MATKPITTGTRLTIEEFLDLPDTELREKMELDDGELYIMPRPRPVHQFLLMRLYMFIATYIDGFAEPPAQVHTDMVTILSPSSAVYWCPTWRSCLPTGLIGWFAAILR